MNPLLVRILGALARHGLTMAGGWLVAQGYLTSSEETQALGALIALGGVAWSAFQKRHVQEKIDAQAQTIRDVHTAAQVQLGAQAQTISDLHAELQTASSQA